MASLRRVLHIANATLIVAIVLAGCGGEPSAPLEPAEPERFDCRRMRTMLNPALPGDPLGSWDYVGGCSERITTRIDEACEAAEASVLSAAVQGHFRMTDTRFERHAYGDTLDFLVELSAACVGKLGVTCDAQALFESPGTCTPVGDACHCQLDADAANIVWKAEDFDVQGTQLSVRVGSLSSAQYTFSIEGDLLVHTSSEANR